MLCVQTHEDALIGMVARDALIGMVARRRRDSWGALIRDAGRSLGSSFRGQGW